jgi:predicted ArsR family transcriptional regulator
MPRRRTLMGERLPLPQRGISKHLEVLREAGLVEVRRLGACCAGGAWRSVRALAARRRVC